MESLKKSLEQLEIIKEEALLLPDNSADDIDLTRDKNLVAAAVDNAKMQLAKLIKLAG